MIKTNKAHKNYRWTNIAPLILYVFVCLTYRQRELLKLITKTPTKHLFYIFLEKMLELNNIYHGDCLEIMKQIPDKSVDLVLTDPPYGMDFQSNHRNIKHKKIELDKNFDWFEDFVKEMGRVISDVGHIYIYMSHHNIESALMSIKKHLRYKNILIWEKNNTGMGDLEGDYAPKFEFIIFCGGKKLNGNRDSNILKFDRTQNELHPTQKPVEMMRYLIQKSTDKGQLVLDPFLGSGTTAVACKEMGRNFIGIEKEKKYVDIANKRLEKTFISLF